MLSGTSSYCSPGGRANLSSAFGGVAANIFIRSSSSSRSSSSNAAGAELVPTSGPDNVCCRECRDFGLEKSVVRGCEGE